MSNHFGTSAYHRAMSHAVMIGKASAITLDQIRRLPRSLVILTKVRIHYHSGCGWPLAE